MTDPVVDLDREVRRAGRARQILEDEFVKEALDEMERAVVDNIAVCPIAETELREKLCMMLSVTRRFRRIFEGHVETGKMAEFQLTQQREKKKRFGII